MRTLILGTDGMLGGVAFRRLRAPALSVEILGTTRRASVASARPSEMFLLEDVITFDAVEALLDRVLPQTILNCVATTAAPHHDPNTMQAINAVFPKRLANAARERGARLVHISTDGVFSGRGGPYDESKAPDPIDTYGQTKLEGEIHEAPHLTVRTSIVGRSPSGTGLLDWAVARRGTAVRGFARALWSGVTTVELVRLLEPLLVADATMTGLAHVVSESVSKAELLRRISAAFDLSLEVTEVDEPAIDRRLISSRADALRAMPLDEQLASLAIDGT